MLRAVLAAVGGVGAAFVSALCCVGPLVAVALGLSGAGLASTFEPLRPYFLGGAAAFLGGGFYLVQREEKKACEPGQVCAEPVVRRRMKIALWGATVLAVIFATSPAWLGRVL